MESKTISNGDVYAQNVDHEEEFIIITHEAPKEEIDQ